MNLTKEVKDLFTENFKTWMTKIRMIQINNLCWWDGFINIAKNPYYSKKSTHLMQLLLKFQKYFSEKY